MIDADSRGRANSPAIETPEQRRKRLVKNVRQRELYPPAHRRRRAELAREIEAGEGPQCPRCLLPVGPDDLWDLGHDDVDPTVTRPEHRACNRAAANRLKTSRDW